MWPLSDARIQEREFDRIAVTLPKWLGDQIMATPALRALRDRYPAAHICGYGTDKARQLYRGAPFFDEFVPTDLKMAPRKRAHELRAGRFDACLLLSNSFREAWTAFLGRIPHRIGYRRHWLRNALLTAHWPRPRNENNTVRYPTKHFFMELVGKLGASGSGRVQLYVSGEEEAAADAWLHAHGAGDFDGPLLGMCVGASWGPSKVWPSEYFARVADHMVEARGARVVLLWGPGEEEVVRAVCDHAHHPLLGCGPEILSVSGLKAVISRCRVLLTNDTGPRHIATAFQVPVVCVMGPTDPIYTETDMDTQVVLREPVECAPCHLQVCPIDHRCMTRVTPDRAILAVEQAWAGAGVPGTPG